MIVGTGVDIIEIERVRRAAEKASFLTRVFTGDELAYWEKKGRSAQTLAGLFAAKEALVKALGKGFGEIGFHDVEIAHSSEGAPLALVHGSAQRMLQKMRGARLLLSISHCRQYAVAQAILEEQP